jgi:hypothetical protein
MNKPTPTVMSKVTMLRIIFLIIVSSPDLFLFDDVRVMDGWMVGLHPNGWMGGWLAQKSPNLLTGCGEKRVGRKDAEINCVDVVGGIS